MYCSNCRTSLEDHDRYCSACGTATENAFRASSRSTYGFSRPREGKKVAGVCAGVARYLDLDVTLVRVIWLLMMLYPPVPGIIAYIVCWIVMPKDPLEAPAPCAQPAQ